MKVAALKLLSIIANAQQNRAIYPSLYNAFLANVDSTSRVARFPNEGTRLTCLALLSGWSMQRRLGKSPTRVPDRIIQRGPPAIKAFFRSLNIAGEDEVRRLLVSLVGPASAGKTSLLQTLKDGKHQGHITESGESRATRGVEVSSYAPRVKSNVATPPVLTCLDFGGQEEYEQTHALFH